MMVVGTLGLQCSQVLNTCKVICRPVMTNEKQPLRLLRSHILYLDESTSYYLIDEDGCRSRRQYTVYTIENPLDSNHIAIGLFFFLTVVANLIGITPPQMSALSSVRAAIVGGYQGIGGKERSLLDA